MPTKCPKCNSNSIDADNIEQDGDIGTQYVTCHTCKFRWGEVWECTRWYNVSNPDDEYTPDEKLSPRSDE